MKLIDKNALIAEIERRRKDWRYGSSIEAKFKREECDDSLSFLNTLEVKEVDLEEEIKKYIEDNICGYCVPGVEETAKHFFELGIKTTQNGK